ncbi:hypothetical protein ERJ75_000239300 [Trypanosoma vivax]|nr:hypothetical protein ERJ75_000239300 [Trypanosoma vivax]
MIRSDDTFSGVRPSVDKNADGGVDGTADDGMVLVLDIGSDNEGNGHSASSGGPRDPTCAGEIHGAGDEGNNSSDAPGTDAVFLSDDVLRFIANKEEAKELGRDAYRRWKNLQRQGRRKHRRHDKVGRKKNKDSGVSQDDGNGGRVSRTARRTKRRRSASLPDTEDITDRLMVEGDGGFDPFSNDGKRVRKTSRRSRAAAAHDGASNEASNGGTKPSDALGNCIPGRTEMKQLNKKNNSTGGRQPRKLTAEARLASVRQLAVELIAKMRNARLDDEVAIKSNRPPLQRILIIKEVDSACRCEALHQFLIENGILQELSTWLYDFSRRELAAYDLRSVALDILLGFAIEGELGTKVLANGDEVLDAFTGMTREHLINTDLGNAVNLLRQDKNEVHENRAKAVRLLERLSRAMTGSSDATPHTYGAYSSALVLSRSGTDRIARDTKTLAWKCQGDSTVAPPFHVVQTGTEAFQRALLQPDPLDPLSYLRAAPWRPPKVSVVNIGDDA